MPHTLKIKQRCPWPGIDDPLYQHYHDTEWGVPLRDDQQLFEKMILEGFQAGLSWLTILKKREKFRVAFDEFDPQQIAQYTKNDLARLMSDAGIVRNKKNIEATIDNARAFLTLSERTSFSDFVWSFRDQRASQKSFQKLQDVPTKTPTSTALSKALKQEGFRFVGPTTMYAFMQSTGMVNDHLITCPRHLPCAKLQN
jgi:DNA-3-methyladenine glycosylase I